MPEGYALSHHLPLWGGLLASLIANGFVVLVWRDWRSGAGILGTIRDDTEDGILGRGRHLVNMTAFLWSMLGCAQLLNWDTAMRLFGDSSVTWLSALAWVFMPSALLCWVVAAVTLLFMPSWLVPVPWRGQRGYASRGSGPARSR